MNALIISDMTSFSYHLTKCTAADTVRVVNVQHTVVFMYAWFSSVNN